MSRLLKAFSSLVLTGQLCAFAQVPATPPAKALALNAQQQAALGIQLAPVQPALGGLWLASATVSVPPGKEVSVTAPYPGVITRISDSIQVSTRAINSAGPMPSGAIGRPIETTMVPGVLMKALRGQQSPEFIAIGTTGTPVPTARMAPPALYLPLPPTGVRVPSGNMITH